MVVKMVTRKKGVGAGSTGSVIENNITFVGTATGTTDRLQAAYSLDITGVSFEAGDLCIFVLGSDAGRAEDQAITTTHTSVTTVETRSVTASSTAVFAIVMDGSETEIGYTADKGLFGAGITAAFFRSAAYSGSFIAFGGGTGSPNPQPISHDIDDTLVIAGFLDDDVVSSDPSPVGWENAGFHGAVGGTDRSSTMIAYNATPTVDTGPTDPPAFVTSSDAWRSWTIVLNPA
jgi:hypothetical protein